MRKIRWFLAAAAAGLIGLVSVLGTTASASADPTTMLSFTTMTPVTGPYVGAANPIRNVDGGGLAWRITSATGYVRSDGHVLVQVRGLVFAEGPNVGRNTIPFFRAIVSCKTISGTNAIVDNVETPMFAASSRGDATIDARVQLPQPCIAPVLFVTAPTGAWFASTGA